MQVNEVVVNGVTELSLVNDTVSEDTLLEGETAHDASGKQIIGKVVVTPVDSELNADSENAIQNKAVAEALQNVDAKTVNGHTVEADVPANAKFTDTTYGVATTSANGLMSAADKVKLNGLSNGATVYTGTYTGNGSTQTITLGAKPKAVIVQKILGGMSATYLATASASSSNTSGSKFVQITNTGFSVASGISASDTTYFYIALA